MAATEVYGSQTATKPQELKNMMQITGKEIQNVIIYQGDFRI